MNPMPYRIAPSRAASLLSSALLALALAACNGSDSSTSEPIVIKLIAMNDFHGNIEVPAANNGGSVVLKDAANPAGTTVRTGGAAYLSTLIRQLRAKNPNSVVVGAGDMIGAAPVTSTLLHDESTVDILNQLGLEVTAVGNHEFDHGKAELVRMQYGGCYPGGQIGQDTCLNGGAFAGASYRYLSANVVDNATGNTLFPATYTKNFNGATVGFIGLTLKDTPSVVTASGVAGLTFTDEIATINTLAARLREIGAAVVVVLIHQGGQTLATTLNDQSCPGLSGAIVPIVDGLNKNAVDVVVSGHTHQEYVCRRNGVLVTQTGFYGSAVTEIDITITPGQGVTSTVANTVPVINDLNTTVPTGYSILQKDATIDAVVQKYAALTAPLKNQVAGTIAADITRALLPGPTPTRDETAEGAMGDVMADVYLAGGPKADVAFINPGGVRADLIYKNGGQVTYGDLITVAPFGNTLVTVDLTGADLLRLLEQQWEAPNCAAKTGANGCGRLLQPSSTITYSWDAATLAGAAVGTGNRIVPGSVLINGEQLNAAKTYRVTLNSFMAPGPGDNFSVVTTKGKNVTNSGVIDIDAFVQYMKTHPNLRPPAPRVTRVH